MTWLLASYSAGGGQGFGVLREDGTLVAPTELKRWSSPLELLEDWDRGAGRAAGPQPSRGSAGGVRRAAPAAAVAAKVICAGVNYRKHMREMGGEIPATGWRPFFFLKAPTTSVIGPRDPIVISSAARARYDWEAELAVVIGVKGKNIDPERAGFHAAAYCVCNDITARGHHKRDTVPADAFRYDWFAAKSMEGSLPLGPGLTPAFLVPDPQDLRLRLWVNGELRQDESTADMVCTVAELIAAASEIVTLEPGDVIATGTPSGVGAARGLYLRGGDEVGSPSTGSAPENTVIESNGELMIFVTHRAGERGGRAATRSCRRLGRPGAQGQQRAAVRAQHDLLRGHRAVRRHRFRPRYRFPRRAVHRADQARATAPGDVQPHRRPGARHDSQRDQGRRGRP